MLNTLWSDDAELQVQLGLGRPDDVTFQLDHDPLGRLDGPGRLGSVDSPFADITCDVRSLTWRQGATTTDGPLTRFEAGTASIVLDNRDATYDITDPATRYLPNVGVRIRARLTGSPTWITQWTGFADSWTLAWSKDLDSTVTVTATDGVKLLRSYNTPEQAPAGAGDTAAQRVSRILTEASWSQGSRVTAGGAPMQATTMAQDSWTMILLNQDAELGATYVAKDGAVVFTPRTTWVNALFADGVEATWGPSHLRYEDLTLVNNDSNYRNIVDASRVGGSAITKQDLDHVARYFPHRYGRMDLPLVNDSDVTEWANYVLQAGLLLSPRLDKMVVLPQVKRDSWSTVINAQFEHRWLVHISGVPGIANQDRKAGVRGWTHEVTPELWRSTFTLIDVETFTWFTLDGGADGTATLDVMRLAA